MEARIPSLLISILLDTDDSGERMLEG